VLGRWTICAPRGLTSFLTAAAAAAQWSLYSDNQRRDESHPGRWLRGQTTATSRCAEMASEIRDSGTPDQRLLFH